jgi:hypothetical protein
MHSLPDVENNYFDPEQVKRDIELYGNGKLKLVVDSIEPEGGPISGNTRLLVRGGPFGTL